MTGEGEPAGETPLTHLDGAGAMHMVDVSAKPVVARRAVASGRLTAAPETISAMVAGDVPKGDVAAAARLAGILAAKRTADLLPLCHPLPLEALDVEIAPEEAAGRISVTATATTTARTGVEMEALTAVSVACLTLWDMLKGVDPDLGIEAIRLVDKQKGV